MTRIALGILMAMLLLAPGVWLNNFSAQRTSAGVSLNSPPSTNINAGPGKPLSNDNSIHNPVDNGNVELKSLFAGGHPGLRFTNDLEADSVDSSIEVSATDTDHVVFVESAVTVLTATLLKSATTDGGGWIYNFADNQSGLYELAPPGPGQGQSGGTSSSGGGGTGNGPGAPNGGHNDTKGTPKPPATDTGTSQAGDGLYRYTPWFHYPPPPPNNAATNTGPLNLSGPNDGHVTWPQNPPDTKTSDLVFQDNGHDNGNSGSGSNPGHNATGGNGDHGDHRDGTGKPPAFQTFSLTNDPPSPPLTETPEPATFTIIGLGLVALGLLRRRATVIR